MKGKPKIIYIAGEGRSGSTLLERILGQHSKIFAAGELIHIWERSFIENQLCSCRKPFKECDIWQNIVNEFLRNVDRNITPSKIIDAFLRTGRIRHYLLRKDFDNKYSKLINEIYYKLYNTILKVTKKEYLVDASKSPVFAHILASNTNIDLFIIHLVRDPRGVAYSWTKKKIRPEIVNKVKFMPRYSVLRSAISWLVVNKIALDLKKYNNDVKYLLIRYEDIVSNSQDILRKIYDFLGLKADPKMLFVDKDIIYLDVNHTVAGNPIRFKTGKLGLKLDDEWRYKLRKDLKLLVTLLTLPYLRKFGYI